LKGFIVSQLLYVQLFVRLYSLAFLILFVGVFNTYLVVAADIGNTITVTVTRTGLSGPVTSTPTGTVTEQPNYGITLDPSVDKTFAAAIVGSAVEPYTLTVQNIGKQLTGALSVSLTGDSSNFELSSTIISSIAVGGSAAFTVKPKNQSGDAVKKYQAIVEVSNANISANIIVDFTPFHATVSFESNGGSAVASYTNREYGTVTKPTDPTKSDGRIFDRWYKEAALTNEWNFSSDNVTENTTLYAKWSYIVTFDSDGGSPTPVPITTALHGTTVSKPATDPTKAFTITEGLYAGKHTDPNLQYTFDGWFAPGASTAFDFSVPITADITLTAKWTSPLIDITSQAGANIVAKTVAYVEANAAADKEYTLFIANDYNFAGKIISTNDFKLTIIGIGSERKINRTGTNGALFNLGVGYQDFNTELTIGNNITLMGTNANIYPMISVERKSTFTMLNGSKITGGNGGGGVSVGNNGTFIMYGGEISGNKVNAGGGGGGGVQNRFGGTFTMHDGKISGNTSEQSGGGVNNEGTFTMLGGEISGNTSNLNGGGIDTGNEFYMVNGTIYGSNETDLALKNTATNISALSVSYTAQHGTFSGPDGAWVSKGTLSNSENTIKVIDGNLE
jgi:uncharacterized repeat protein (TIGR02543 family)